MLQTNQPDDYVVATGELHSVRDFVREAFAVVDLPWEKYISTQAVFNRPSDPVRLVGNARKIREQLGWQPRYDFRSLVQDMVQSDLNQQAPATTHNEP
jgi:GDPmannose 4,6-dehydratase